MQDLTCPLVCVPRSSPTLHNAYKTILFFKFFLGGRMNEFDETSVDDLLHTLAVNDIRRWTMRPDNGTLQF